MNAFREDTNSYCYFHPKEIVVGVCPLCLNERLLVLAAKQSKRSNHHSSARASRRIYGASAAKNISLPKIFAVGGSLLHRLDFRHPKFNASDDLDTSTSHEDSFISIKFEENGMAQWEKAAGTVSKVSLEHCSMSWNHGLTKETTNKSVIEHPNKPHASLRWRKRIGHIFHLIRWKRSNKANVCHVGAKVEGVKVRKGWWMRTLTKRI